ncbi:hypothetical protein Aau02nite_01230 [Amorphoplanes auranticolor]|uniref:Uncharacterized protein n=1 Tax=Actinoplanes auranticolor TaxID=47988 RepID=A0A919S469_9ACTN|nr:hypothetical protein Aau02nite_01230 [Actinoplanes auranticolor]
MWTHFLYVDPLLLRTVDGAAAGSRPVPAGHRLVRAQHHRVRRAGDDCKLRIAVGQKDDTSAAPITVSVSVGGRDRRPVAGGVYDAAAGRTSISWAGQYEDNYVQSYEHRTGVRSDPVRVAGGDSDSHNYPTPIQAADGHRHDRYHRNIYYTAFDPASVTFRSAARLSGWRRSWCGCSSTRPAWCTPTPGRGRGARAGAPGTSPPGCGSATWSRPGRRAGGSTRPRRAARPASAPTG